MRSWTESKGVLTMKYRLRYQRVGAGHQLEKFALISNMVPHKNLLRLVKLLY